jgi:hypothetical protein
MKFFDYFLTDNTKIQRETFNPLKKYTEKYYVVDKKCIISAPYYYNLSFAKQCVEMGDDLCIIKYDNGKFDINS